MKCSSRVVSFLLILALICTYAIPILADTAETTDPTETAGTSDTTGTDDTTDQTDETTQKETTLPTAQDTGLAQTISKAYGITVTPQDIVDLRVNNSLGYGEIGIMYGMVNASGKTVADILAMRGQDLGWGAIAKSLGLKMSDLMSRNSSVLKAAKLEKEAKVIKDKVDQEQKEQERLSGGQTVGNGQGAAGTGQGKGTGAGKGSGKGKGKG